MPASQPLALLFDLDGTLIDSIELIVMAARHAFSTREGPAPTEEQFLATVGRPLVAQFGPYATSDNDMQALLVAYREYQLTHHDRLTRCYEDVHTTLDALRQLGHPMAVVTSKRDEIAARSISYVGLERYVDCVVGCDTTTKHKPDPEPVLCALDRLGARADQAVFLGDSPYDVQAGNAAGVTSVAACWGAFPRDALESVGPDYVIERMREFGPLVGRLASGRHLH
jgi:pyrophosphatase PpaX